MRIFGVVIALLMIAGGVAWALAGMGYIGNGVKSSGAANGGAILAGLGVALVYVSLKRH